MPLENESDEVLIADALQGDSSAFGQLCKGYQSRLIGFFIKAGCDEDTAKDMVQEAWLQVWRKRHRFERGHRFWPWLIALARNKYKDIFRKPANRERGVGQYASPNDDKTPETPEPIVAPSRNQTLPDELKAKLWDCINRLDPKFRDVIVGHYVDELPFTELVGT